ncbi:hypothetical protein CIB84_007473, partial [Bambusicola thoracicus]
MEKCLVGGRMSKPWAGSGKEAAASRSVSAWCCYVPLGMEGEGTLGQSDCGSWLDFTKGGGKRSDREWMREGGIVEDYRNSTLHLALLSPQASFGSSSPVGSLSSEDHDFDPSAEMLVHDYDDEQTLEEEEMMEENKNFGSEIEDLEKEGNMPLEDLLAFYGYEPTIPVMAGSSADSSPSELTDELPDMTLDKLKPNIFVSEANTTCDGDKESDGEDVEVDSGNTSEDLRKEIMVGSKYQAEIPPYLGRCTDDEKG